MGITFVNSDVTWRPVPVEGSDWIMTRVLGLDEPFTRSNGTILARLYERLTKASRRRTSPDVLTYVDAEAYYRQGLYDAYKALQEECA